MIDKITLQNLALYIVRDYTEHLAIQRNALLIFKTRDEYLKWVTEWKAQYAEISLESRKAKIARKTSLPTYSYYAPGEVWKLKQQANAMLWLRAEAKKLSWQQKIAEFIPAT